jgi:hypothetical protein
MKFPVYWIKVTHTGMNPEGKKMTVDAYGWSSISRENARLMGEKRAKRAFEAIGREKRKDYEYHDAPFREEVVRKIDAGGTEIGVISRNRYGALVLNTSGVLFADIDFPQIKSDGFVDALLSAFSSKRRMDKQKRQEALILDRLESWWLNHKSCSFRAYQTHSGFRIMFTDTVYDPKSSETKEILQALGSDPLYEKLTEKQECFRARLTPKPWRCGIRRPPNEFPWETRDAEDKYRQWEKAYHDKCTGYGTCILVKEYGSPAKDLTVSTILKLHDSLTLHQGKPLA